MITAGGTRRDLRSQRMSSLLTSEPSQLPGGILGISESEAASKKHDSVRYSKRGNNKSRLEGSPNQDPRGKRHESESLSGDRDRVVI